jgi:hypothetical protein
MTQRKGLLLTLLTTLGVGVLAGCTYEEGYRGNPFLQSTSWFSYLNADDLRAKCRAGGPARYRIVYNGLNREQVRTYDITVHSPGAHSPGGGDLVVQIHQDPNLLDGFTVGDPLKPWSGVIKRRRIDESAIRAIREGLKVSGIEEPAPKGLRLKSYEFFWLASGCEKGRFSFHAWKYPSPEFARVRLMGPLAAVDPTKIPFNPPRRNAEPDPVRDGFDNEPRSGGAPSTYELYIGENGLATPFGAL